MGEIKQANFRIDKDDADAFRRFCLESHFSQAQGFAYLLRYAAPSACIEADQQAGTLSVENITEAVKAAVQEVLAENHAGLSKGNPAAPSEKLPENRWQQLHFDTAKENASLKAEIKRLREENDRLRKFSGNR